MLEKEMKIQRGKHDKHTHSKHWYKQRPDNNFVCKLNYFIEILNSRTLSKIISANVNKGSRLELIFDRGIIIKEIRILVGVQFIYLPQMQRPQVPPQHFKKGRIEEENSLLKHSLNVISIGSRYVNHAGLGELPTSASQMLGLQLSTMRTGLVFRIFCFFFKD